MSAAMSHMGARVLAVLRENKPYELRDIEGRLISKNKARSLILWRYQVPEEIRRDRQRRTATRAPSHKPLRKRKETVSSRSH
jgi:hypothetical protein